MLFFVYVSFFSLQLAYVAFVVRKKRNNFKRKKGSLKNQYVFLVTRCFPIQLLNSCISGNGYFFPLALCRYHVDTWQIYNHPPPLSSSIVFSTALVGVCHVGNHGEIMNSSSTLSQSQTGNKRLH